MFNLSQLGVSVSLHQFCDDGGNIKATIVAQLNHDAWLFTVVSITMGYTVQTFKQLCRVAQFTAGVMSFVG